MRDIKVTLAGDAGVGKSSLVTFLVKDCFSERVQPVVPEITLPLEATEAGVPTRIVDTSSTPDKRSHLETSLRSAHVIVLVYSISSPTSFDRIPTYWLPYLRSLGIINVPVILVGNKIDLRSEAALTTNEALEDELAPVMAEFKEVESCIETSVREGVNVSEVFHYAQKSVLYPTAPLYDSKTHTLKEPCIAALKRIFRLCDSDKDHLLSDDELNDFQRRCFGVPLQDQELQRIKELVAAGPPAPTNNSYPRSRPSHPDLRDRGRTADVGPLTNRLSTAGPRSSSSSGGSVDGSTSFNRKRQGSASSSHYVHHPHLQDGMFTLAGWLHLHTLFIQKGRLETTWQVLRSYGYGQDLALSPDYLNPPFFAVPPGCSVELSPYGYSFLTDIFEAHDKDRDGALSEQELTELFATAPGGRHPWEDSDFPHTTVTDENGAVTLQGWLAQWSMTTLLDYKVTLANLAYLGYPNFILGGKESASGGQTAHDGGSGHHQHHAHTSSIASIPPMPDASPSSPSSSSSQPSPPPTTTALTLTRRNPRRAYSSWGASPSSSSSSSSPNGSASATKKKKKKGDPAERSVFLAYVVGASGSGKTSLLRAMVGKRFDAQYRPTTRTRSVVSAIEQGGMERYLVLQEFGSRFESEHLRSHAKLALADVIIYVYDSSDTNSFSYISNLRQQFSSSTASRSSSSALPNLPCLFVATKTDQDLAQQRHEVQPDVYCKKLGLERNSPFHVSTLEGVNVHDLYALVVQIAQDPAGMDAIPGGKERAAAARMGSMFAWMGAVVVVGGVGAGVWVWYNGKHRIVVSGSASASSAPAKWWNWVIAGTSRHGEL